MQKRFTGSSQHDFLESLAQIIVDVQHRFSVLFRHDLQAALSMIFRTVQRRFTVLRRHDLQAALAEILQAALPEISGALHEIFDPKISAEKGQKISSTGAQIENRFYWRGHYTRFFGPRHDIIMSRHDLFPLGCNQPPTNQSSQKSTNPIVSSKPISWWLGL